MDSLHLVVHFLEADVLLRQNRATIPPPLPHHVPPFRLTSRRSIRTRYSIPGSSPGRVERTAGRPDAGVSWPSDLWGRSSLQSRINRLDLRCCALRLEAAGPAVAVPAVTSLHALLPGDAKRMVNPASSLKMTATAQVVVQEGGETLGKSDLKKVGHAPAFARTRRLRKARLGRDKTCRRLSAYQQVAPGLWIGSIGAVCTILVVEGSSKDPDAVHLRPLHIAQRPGSGRKRHRMRLVMRSLNSLPMRLAQVAQAVRGGLP